MSRQLSFALVMDGSSDAALLPIIRWTIHRLDPGVDILEPEVVVRSGPLDRFFEHFESQAMVVFVHRDSEREAYEARLREFDGIEAESIVPIVPVRMTEAWLLVDGPAIARAADCPHASVELPAVATLEGLSDPKQVLHDLLYNAAGQPRGRRGKKFRNSNSLTRRRLNVASLIEDFSPLERLSAFRRFQEALRESYPYGA